MAVESSRSSFDFAQLRSARPELRVVVPPVIPLPPPARLVAPVALPRGVGRLLAVFAAAEPLRTDLMWAAAPAFGCSLQQALGLLLAGAGAAAGVRVVGAPGLLVAGGHALVAMPARPHAVLVAAEPSACSLEVAAAGLRDADGRGWLVLHGRFPFLDAALGLDRPPFSLLGPRLVRLPQLDGQRLRALSGSRLERGLALALRRLATGLCASYVEQARCRAADLPLERW